LIEQIFNIIAEIGRRGITVLLVEQNVQAALSLASRAYVIETGRVTMAGSGRELLRNPRVRDAFLGGHADAA
jgi:branched-chain amino acid transport system ATP-binding protein